jgi:hypothetical protein
MKRRSKAARRKPRFNTETSPYENRIRLPAPAGKRRLGGCCQHQAEHPLMGWTGRAYQSTFREGRPARGLEPCPQLRFGTLPPLGSTSAITAST